MKSGARIFALLCGAALFACTADHPDSEAGSPAADAPAAVQTGSKDVTVLSDSPATDGVNLTLPFGGEDSRSETDYKSTRTETEMTRENNARLLSVGAPPGTQRPLPPGELLTLSASVGTAGEIFFAKPRAESPFGLLWVHELDGLTPRVTELVRNFAADGFATMAPNFYGTGVPPSRAEAVKLSGRFGEELAVARLSEAARELRSRMTQPELPLIVCGSGIGGAAALQYALHGDPAPAILVLVYSDFPAQPEELKKVVQALKARNVALLGLFADRDEWVTPARVAMLSAALLEAGVDHQVETYATHPGFMVGESPQGGYQDIARKAIAAFGLRRLP